MLKSVEDAQRYVCPFLVDLKPSELLQPLAQLQVTKPDREGVAKLVKTLNALGDTQLRDDVVNRSIEKWWSLLEGQLEAARASAAAQPQQEPRRTGDMVEELLELTRGLQRSILNPEPRVKGTVNITSAEFEERRLQRIRLRIGEILSNADIPYQIASVHGNTAEVKVAVGTQIPDNVKAELDRLTGGGLNINIIRDL